MENIKYSIGLSNICANGNPVNHSWLVIMGNNIDQQFWFEADCKIANGPTAHDCYSGTI